MHGSAAGAAHPARTAVGQRRVSVTTCAVVEPHGSNGDGQVAGVGHRDGKRDGEVRRDRGARGRARARHGGRHGKVQLPADDKRLRLPRGATPRRKGRQPAGVRHRNEIKGGHGAHLGQRHGARAARAAKDELFKEGQVVFQVHDGGQVRVALLGRKREGNPAANTAKCIR